VRILRGAEQSESHYAATLARRLKFIEATAKRIEPFDAIVMPTVPIVPPAIAALASDEAFTQTNLLVLRNTSLVNLMDGCAISIPMTAPDNPPTGLMLATSGGRDAELLSLAGVVEKIVRV
jgi:aspartyl-tRNA(Asn)/glutamyl-tRNA(Gln) amidotransferase subunit A